MAVLTSLKLFNPHDLDAFAMIYNHFDKKHEAASLLESRSMQYMQHWLSKHDKDCQNEDLLEAMRHLIEAAEVLSRIDAGHKTHRACARVSLLSPQIVTEFVVVVPLQPSTLLKVARFYRAEVAARGEQSHFSSWLSPRGLLAEWVKHLGGSFRSLLEMTRDLRVRMQLATIATEFGNVIDACGKVLDKVPENAGPLVLRRGHGGA